MGEIIFSIAVGGCLVLSGIILLVASKKESKRELARVARETTGTQEMR